MPAPGPIRLTLPATSANLGPGFDAVGLALGLHLVIDARTLPAPATHRIEATGRNAGLCASLDRNLILDTYTDVLRSRSVPAPPLHLRLENGIPLGMGCGSSAAALLAGVMLASHFGGLAWDLHACLDEASRREGHPDNVTACALGGLTVSCESAGSVPCETAGKVVAATLGLGLPWKLLLALPTASLATEKARALLPDQYTRADAVANIQRTALLVAAFAQARPELLATAMQDRIHQPYRASACPLLPRLLPLAGRDGIFGVALSGAGPSVLLIAEPEVPTPHLSTIIRSAAADPTLEVLETRIAPGATQTSL